MDEFKTALKEQLSEHRARTDAGLDNMRKRVELANKTGSLDRQPRESRQYLMCAARRSNVRAKNAPTEGAFRGVEQVVRSVQACWSVGAISL